MERITNADYYHARGACYLCLQPHDGVDTSVQIEYEGVLFICKGCIGDLARTAGYSVDTDRTEQIAGLKHELADESARADEAERLLRLIDGYKEKITNLAKASKARWDAEVTA